MSEAELPQEIIHCRLKKDEIQVWGPFHHAEQVEESAGTKVFLGKIGPPPWLGGGIKVKNLEILSVQVGL